MTEETPEGKLQALETENQILKQTVQQSSRVHNLYRDAVSQLREKKFELQKNKAILEENYRLQKLMQEELVEREKMAALGSLVAGVAHEVNTPLGTAFTSISITKQMIQEFKESLDEAWLGESDHRRRVEKIEKSAALAYHSLEKAVDLIRGFKQISMDQNTSGQRQIDVNHYLQDVLKTFASTLKQHRVQCTIKCPEGLLVITYPGPLSQIVTVLINNALLHAFEPGKGGRIAIQVEMSGNQLHFEYSDNGRGMAEDVKKRAFEPFFTTLRSSGQSGLGLSVLYNEVTHRFGGKIRLESEAGKGCKIFFSLTVS